jgi:hypothetical protein
MMAEIVNLNDYRQKRLQNSQESRGQMLTCQVDLLVEELKKIIADVKLVNH